VPMKRTLFAVALTAVACLAAAGSHAANDDPWGDPKSPGRGWHVCTADEMISIGGGKIDHCALDGGVAFCKGRTWQCCDGTGFCTEEPFSRSSRYIQRPTNIGDEIPGGYSAGPSWSSGPRVPAGRVAADPILPEPVHGTMSRGR
ncbi:MAG: hypothetical protein MI723_14965, partial [Caulobacterales bacterium]|nr:hypothetical protein [Caulobacterales bacterium]